MSAVGRAASYLGKILAEELVKASANHAGQKIGAAIGQRIGKSIDPPVAVDKDKAP